MKIAQFQQFSFEGCNRRTTVVTSVNPWFKTGDICKVRAIANSRHALTRFEQDKRSARVTAVAAFHLNRLNQTLCMCAVNNEVPVKCLRIKHRLAWPTDAIRELLGF